MFDRPLPRHPIPLRESDSSTHVSILMGAERTEVLAEHTPDIGPDDTAPAVHVEVSHFHQLLERKDPRLRHVAQNVSRPAIVHSITATQRHSRQEQLA